MKKLLCILVSILLLCACTGKKDDITSNSAIKNSVELKTSTFSIDGYEFFDKNATIAIKKIGFNEALRMFDEKGTGIVVWGYQGCPYCQRALPVLNDAAVESGIDVYYVDLRAEDIANMSDDEWMESYSSLVNNLADILTVEDGEPVMYVPEVVAIKYGKIVGHHLSLVDSFDSSVQNEMNEDQKLELINIYLDMIKKLQ